MRALLLTVFLILPGCATLDPAKICTAEWIAPRADRAVDAIESDTSRLIRAVKSAGESFARGNTPGPLKMLQLSRALNGLERELTDGRGIRDLRTLARTCDNPAVVETALYDWLDRQNLPSGLRNFIDDVGLIERLAALPDETG